MTAARDAHPDGGDRRCVRVRLVAIAFAAGLGLMAAPLPASAAVRALLIGIDDYVGPPKLRGAVNDVDDLARVLRARGIDPVVLKDAAATRDGVIAAFRAMSAESDPDDLLYVHFSGHGISIPDDNGDEEDGFDESYLLRGFDEETNPGEQLVDDDLDALFASAGRAVLFVADACHSGSPARAVAGSTLPERLYRPRLTPTRPAPLERATGGLPASVFAVGATADDRTVPEIMIGGVPRGALSYATARAFEGAADLDGDGRVSADEYEVFVRQTVRTLAASRQTPQFELPDQRRLLMEVEPQDVDAGTAAPLPGVRIYFDGMEQPPTGAELVADPTTADLVFDPDRGEIFNGLGDLVASGPGVFAHPAAATDASRVVAGLAAMSMQRPLSVRLAPDDGVHPAGSIVRFWVDAAAGRHITVFDISASGAIHHLWPLEADEAGPWAGDRPFRLDTRVTAPYGGDTLVVVATDHPPDDLRALLAAADRTSQTRPIYHALARMAQEAQVSIGLQAFFTSREPGL